MSEEQVQNETPEVEDAIVAETGTEESKSEDQEVIEKTLIDEALEEGDDDERSDDEESDDQGGSEELKMPELEEGMPMDHGLFEKMLPALKEAGINQDGLNKIVETYASHVKEASDKHSEMLIEKYNEIKDDWKNTAVKELGAEFKQSAKLTGKALEQFGSPELLELFRETGVGNNIEVIKFCSKVGKHFTEDGLVDGKSSGDVSPEDSLYPTMK